MAKKADRIPCFSPEFRAKIAEVCAELSKDGSPVTRNRVAGRIARERVFTEDNRDLLTMFIGEAVKHEEVKGLTSRRGPGGGLYPVAKAKAA